MVKGVHKTSPPPAFQHLSVLPKGLASAKARKQNKIEKPGTLTTGLNLELQSRPGRVGAAGLRANIPEKPSGILWQRRIFWGRN